MMPHRAFQAETRNGNLKETPDLFPILQPFQCGCARTGMKTEMLQLFPMNLCSWRKRWSILTKKNIWEVASAAQLWNAVGQPILMVENPPGHRGIQSSKEWETVEVWRKDQRFMKGRLLETSESTSLLKGQNLENNKKKLYAPPLI